MKKKTALLMILLIAIAMLAGCGKEDEPSVYYLNFKPEADRAWQELAQTYTEQTGIEVKVVTAASGAYEETLTAEMSKKNAPTLFQCGKQTTLDNWKEYCLDLRGTDFYNEMTTDDFNLMGENGEVYAAAYCYEAYGLITNVRLLRQAGYTLADITDFDSLKAIAEDITARSDELGFAAFTSSGLDESSAWRFSGHLVNMPLFYEFEDNGVTSQPSSVTGAYLDNFKNIWDLYINNSTCAPVELATKTVDESQAEFGQGKAVFYQNGTWEYAKLVEQYAMNPDDLAMIPIYIGVDGEERSALACGTENCWAVNSQASEADIQATLDFMTWVVTSDEGTAMMAEQFGSIPFKNAKPSENVFFNDADRYIANGNYVVDWVFGYTPNIDRWRAAVVSALLQYSANHGSWENVEKAFVDGWAAQYKEAGL